MQPDGSESDAEDDNIWRLVAKDPERTHHNVTPSLGRSFSSRSQSKRHDLTHQKSASTLSTQKSTRRVRPIHIVALVSGCLAVAILLVVYCRARVESRETNISQHSTDIPSTSSQILDMTAAEPNLDSSISAPSAATSFLRMPWKNAGTTKEEEISLAADSVLTDLQGLKSIWQHPRPSDTPVLLNIGYELSGSKPIKDILWTCHHFTVAGEDARNIIQNYPSDKAEIVSIREDKSGLSDLRVVSVDTTVKAETIRAKTIGLAKSGLADFMVVKNIYDANDMFDPLNQGRVFALFRHPMHAAWGAYHSLQYTHPHLSSITFEAYVDSKEVGQNWMTRALNNLPMNVGLNDTHYLRAVEVVHEKIFVGLESQREESLSRFERFFSWAYKEDPVKQEQCRSNHLSQTVDTEEKRTMDSSIMMSNGLTPEEGERLYEALLRKNHFDMKLYDKVLELFEAQTKLVVEIPKAFRTLNATCCKCDDTC